MSQPARVLCLGGLDPTGAAGLLRDRWALGIAGGQGWFVPTCLTAQTPTRFLAARAVPPDYLAGTLDALLAEERPAAIKIGLVVDAATWRALLPRLQTMTGEGVRLVVDPIRAPSIGDFTVGDDVRALLAGEVLALHPILTPNEPELFWLQPDAGPDAAAAQLVARGAAGVLHKGGHAAPRDEVEDRWHDAQGCVAVRRPRHAGPPRRGTGCVLSTLLAFELGSGLEPRQASRVAGHMLWQRWAELEPGLLGS
jgi:hydroxymethylpyrimidine/phosphomethylpyrimidine kinase